MEPYVLKYNELDFTGVASIQQLNDLLAKYGCNRVLIKKLVKNNNDKNQIYFHHDASLLNSVFSLSFGMRSRSKSNKKAGTYLGEMIPEARFDSFAWCSTNGALHTVKHCKGILYLQYPEVRLSGFKAESGVMPYAISVEFTKLHPQVPRYLAIGATQSGKAFAAMIVSPEREFCEGFEELSYFHSSKICKFFYIKENKLQNTATATLKTALLNHVLGKDMKGCRLKPDGSTVPFTGTQVHGYTLEHALGIATNASKDGDFLGIELKCFTRNKLTLFTPEPDGGLYADSFEQFMLKYGYAKEAVYRFTGLHRVGQVCESSQLSLEVLCMESKRNGGELMPYDPSKPFHKQMQGLNVVLRDQEGTVAASWSLTRLLNNWGVKHNEVVYVPAAVKENTIRAEFEEGYKKRIFFGSNVLWCQKTSLEKMINAIATGIIFLDPAPKLDTDNPRNNKRRSQWRINNIYKDSQYLYESVENFPE